MGDATRQIVPPNEEIWVPWEQESAEKREWDYSYYRLQSSAVGNPLGSKEQPKYAWSSVRITWSGGKPSIKKSGGGSLNDRGQGTGYGLYALVEFEKWPVEPVVVPTWAQRGLAWLGVDRQEVVPGSVNIGADAMTSEKVSFVEPQLYVETDAVIDVSKDNEMGGIGTILTPENAQVRSIRIILPQAFKPRGWFVEPVKQIMVTPMTGSGEFIENFDLISASGERVTLYLYNENEVQLYLLEDK
jgi:hypothetical protein